jgi:hypothetical protein
VLSLCGGTFKSPRYRTPRLRKRHLHMSLGKLHPLPKTIHTTAKSNPPHPHPHRPKSLQGTPPLPLPPFIPLPPRFPLCFPLSPCPGSPPCLVRHLLQSLLHPRNPTPALPPTYQLSPLRLRALSQDIHHVLGAVGPFAGPHGRKAAAV